MTSDLREQFTLLLTREQVFRWLGNHEAQSADLLALTTLVEQLDDDRCRLKVVQRRLGTG